MKSSQTTPHMAEADILANAQISDQPEIIRIDQLAPEIQAHIAAGRSEGLHLVSVRWLTGQFVYMFCEPGTNMPSPEKVIAGYYQCFRANSGATFGGAP